MAQTKQKQSGRTQAASRNGSKPGTTGGNRASKRSTANRSNSSRSNGSRSTGSRARSAKSRSARKPTGVRGRAADALETVKSGGEKAGTAVAKRAGKARTPLVAGGAAVLGLAGGAALARGGAGRKLGRLPIPPLSPRTSTAKALVLASREVGKAGFQVGQLASEVRRVREGMKNS